MKFKDFYEIPNFKKLDKVGKTIFVFSFVLPILIVYTFLHLYFWPFGLERTYELNDRGFSFSNTTYLYTIDEEELLDGIAEVKLETRIPKRNLRTRISVEGENIYLIPEAFGEDDINFTPNFTRNFQEDFDYILLSEYQVKDEDILVFKIDYELDIYRDIENELLLKYKNLRIIQRQNSVELRVDEILGEEFKTFETNLGLDFEIPEEEEEEEREERIENIEIYAIYKKPTDTNGFIELFLNNRISRRTVIPSDEKIYDDMFEDFGIETIWNDELIKDITQEFISLKQEEYTVNLLNNVPENLRNVIDLNLYYEKLFKPEGFEEEGDSEYEGDQIISEHYFRYDESYYNRRFHVFYDKEFFNFFEGDINRVSVGYEYPISLKKEFGTLRNTPMFFRIVGENSNVENIIINIQREPVWKKF